MQFSLGDNHVAIASPGCYLLSVAAAVLAVRVTLSVFKALAMKDHEHRIKGQPDPIRDYSFSSLLWIAFSGFRGNATTRDYCLPLMIGAAELCAYPVLLQTNQ